MIIQWAQKFETLNLIFLGLGSKVASNRFRSYAMSSDIHHCKKVTFPKAKVTHVALDDDPMGSKVLSLQHDLFGPVSIDPFKFHRQLAIHAI